MKRALPILLTLFVTLCSVDMQAQTLSAFRDSLSKPFPAFAGASTVTVSEHGDAMDAVAKAAHENLRLRFKGYRVCIFFDNGQDARAGAEAARSLFTATYPTTKVYISYNAPYFTVTAGDCVTAEEAIILMGRIRETFPKAFPRSEELTVADLLN